MSNFTHSICYDCWDKKNPERKALRSDPGAINHINYINYCCFCGKAHETGIFIREDRDIALCRALHPGGNWPEDNRKQVIEMVIVYDDPTDYPGLFVARRHMSMDDGSTIPGEVIAKGRTLAEVRAAIPAGMYRIPRDIHDDPKIVECWI